MHAESSRNDQTRENCLSEALMTGAGTQVSLVMISTMMTPLTLATIAMGLSSAITPVPRDGWHGQRHEAMNAVVQAHAGPIDAVFIGDSITQGWEEAGRDVWSQYYKDRTALNLGISGDRTEHVLWRLDHGNLEGIQPRVAVIMIGTNNIGHGTHTTAEVLAGVQAVVAKVREQVPSTQVLLLDIFPRGSQFNEARGKILQVNQALVRLQTDPQVHYLPIGHVFLEDDGTIHPSVMPDGLHLSPEGYRRWAEAIEPTMSVLLQDRDEHVSTGQ